jgi:hypothetical protein
MTPETAYQPGLSFRRYRDIGKDLPILTVNASLLKKQTPCHAKFAMDDDDGASEALSIGDAVHKAVLEPEAFDNRFDEFYLWSPTKGLDTKAAIEARIMNPDHILLTPDHVEKIKRMREAIYKHKLASFLLEKCTYRELSGVAPDKDLGVVRKIRVDACDGIGIPGQPWSDYIVDIKTTRADLSPSAIRREVIQFGYDIQAAFYLDTDAIITGKPRHGFVFIFVTNYAPYCCRVFHLMPEQIDKARDLYKRRLAALSDAYIHQQWEAWENESDPIAIAL